MLKTVEKLDHGNIAKTMFQMDKHLKDLATIFEFYKLNEIYCCLRLYDCMILQIFCSSYIFF